MSHQERSENNQTQAVVASPSKRFACWAVHFYTSLGLPINLLSLWALTQGDGTLFFCLNLLAVCIDATDGFMARQLSIKTVLPQFDGAKLDDLIDYLTFTFLPISSLYYLKILPESYWPLLGLALISSAYGFCQTQAKTEDAFVGFPSYWNLVAYYIFLLRPELWIDASVIIFLSILTFVPIHFIYPTRTVMWQKTTLIGSLIYVLLLLYSAFGSDNSQRLSAAYLSLTYVLYYWIASGVHHFRIHRDHREMTSQR